MSTRVGMIPVPSFCLHRVLLLAAARCPASSLPAPATAPGHPAHPRSKPTAISSAKSLLRRDAEKSGACRRRRAGMPRGSLAERSGLSHPIWSPPSVADFCFSAVTDKSPVWTRCRWKHGRGHSRFGNTPRRGTIDILLWSAPFPGALLSNFLAPLGTFRLFHWCRLLKLSARSCSFSSWSAGTTAKPEEVWTCLSAFSAPARASTPGRVPLSSYPPDSSLSRCFREWVLQPLFMFRAGI